MPGIICVVVQQNTKTYIICTGVVVWLALPAAIMLNYAYIALIATRHTSCKVEVYYVHRLYMTCTRNKQNLSRQSEDLLFIVFSHCLPKDM